MRAKPLAGLTVLDLTRLLPGPMCTQHLADLGADVLKVEDPAGGDYARWMGQRQKVNSTSFLLFNRNKRSLTLDLKKPEAQQILLKLAADADIVVEGFRPGVADRLGVGYAAVRALNPKVVYASITGYGQDGPWAQRAGHDMNYLAHAGVLDQTGTAGGPPALSNFQIADLAGGSLSAVMGILAALVDAQRTGQGRHVDVAMTDCVLAHTVVALSTLNAGQGAEPRGQGRLSGGQPNYGVYETADGRWLAVGALEQKFWSAFCAAIGTPELEGLGYATGAEGERVRAAVAERVRARPLAEWAAVFARVDACVSPVLTPEEALESEQARGRGLVVEHDHPVEGPVRQYAFPIRMTDFAFSIDRPAPMQGEHTAEVLAGLGYGPEEQARLKAEGVV